MQQRSLKAWHNGLGKEDDPANHRFYANWNANVWGQDGVDCSVKYINYFRLDQQVSLEDLSKEWNHFDLTYILWFLWFGIFESSSTQEHQLNCCWHSWKNPESVHRFIQHCYDCYLVQVANTESFITISSKKQVSTLKWSAKRHLIGFEKQTQ